MSQERRLIALRALVHELELENARLRRRNAALPGTCTTLVGASARCNSMNAVQAEAEATRPTVSSADGMSMLSFPDEIWTTIGAFLSSSDLTSLLSSSRHFSRERTCAPETCVEAPQASALHEAARLQVVRLCRSMVWFSELGDLMNFGKSNPRAWPQVLSRVECFTGMRTASLQFVSASPQVNDRWWQRLKIDTQNGAPNELSAEDILREASTPPRWSAQVVFSDKGAVATSETQRSTLCNVAGLSSARQTAVCDSSWMVTGRHYCEFTIRQPSDGESAVGFVSADYDVSVHDPPRLCGGAWSGSMVPVSTHAYRAGDLCGSHEAGTFKGSEQCSTIGVLLDLDQETMDVFIFSTDQCGRHRRGEASVSFRESSRLHVQRRPLRWAVELSGGASIRVRAKHPDEPQVSGIGKQTRE